MFDFVTSDFVMPAQKVADIYRQRWAVELLFRWLKGHLNIRRFSMKNKNAINIQLIIASILQLLLRLKRETEKLACTDWELLRKLRTAIERYFYETRLGTALRDLDPIKPPAATTSVEPEP